jgi:hypothetical protein
MVLLLHENFSDLLRHGELAESLTLANPLPVVQNGFILIIQVEVFTGLGVTLGILPR